jgi:hypothetical protein
MRYDIMSTLYAVVYEIAYKTVHFAHYSCPKLAKTVHFMYPKRDGIAYA